MFCKFCGNQLPDGSDFCTNCGKALVVTTTNPTIQPQTPPVEYTQAPVQPVAAVDEPVKGKKGKKAKAPKDPNKKSKKKIFIPIIALVLVAAIVTGVLLIFQNPAVKVFSAAKKTIFESSEMKITIIAHSDNEWYEEHYGITENMDSTIEIELFFGENIESSEGKFTEKYKTIYDKKYDEYYDYYTEFNDENPRYEVREREYSYSYKSGKFYEDGVKREEDLNSVAKMGEDWLKENCDVDIDIIDVANMVIKGKIDEDGLAEVFNTILVPNIEKIFNENMNTKLDLPEFEGVLGNGEDFLKRAYKEEVIELEKVKSENKGTTYKYEIDVEKLAKCFLEYIQEEEELSKYLQYAVDREKEMAEKNGKDIPIDDVEDLITYLEENIDEIDVDLEGKVTVHKGRITYLTIGDDEKTYYTITIESKK